MDPLSVKILSFLKSHHHYISGQQLSDNLDTSRTAIWKHIQHLRNLGYEIEAVPHLGYQLLRTPDRLFPWEIGYRLSTKFIGKDIYYFESISSTMDVAHNLAKQKVPEGTVVVAETQTEARGRFRRKWLCAKYRGIYLSLILRPKVSPNYSSIFTLLSAVAVSEAIGISTGIHTNVKWPNDIILENKKLAGILTEMEAEMDELHYIVIGIGINVNNQIRHFLDSAISLYEYKKEKIDRIELMRNLLVKLEEYYLLYHQKGIDFILDRWRAHTDTLGRIVKIFGADRTIVGLAVDVDSDGSLLLRKDTGLIEKINSGDLVYCR